MAARAEALRAFKRVRGVLADELGISPSPALIELERRILDQDPTLAWTPRPPTGTGLEVRNADQAGRADRPVGTVTFLFTDVEGSTRLWEESPEAMRLALAAHDGILRTVIEEHGGYVFSTAGDVVLGGVLDAGGCGGGGGGGTATTGRGAVAGAG